MLSSLFSRGRVSALALTFGLGLALSTSANADLRFSCSADQQSKIESALLSYFDDLGMAHHTVEFDKSDPSALTVRLASELRDTSTVNLRFHPALAIREEQVSLPTSRPGVLRAVDTVSRKEILYALMQSGRVTSFSGNACAFESLQDHVGVRQLTVAWAENLQWGWPDGGPAQWNDALWNKGTPRQGVDTFHAFTDVFVNPQKYAVGCYTATKFVMVQGVLDYYRRVKGDEHKARLVEQRLWEDGDPLVGIEPRRMWSFESDYDAMEAAVPGKYLKLLDDVAPGNFVPGDWAYFLNTDPVSYEKTGYEGSNAIYLGRNRFNDHYADNGGHYLYLEKLRMVYQWRNGVFSRSRDYAKIEPLGSDKLFSLERTPAEGGLLMALRAVPYYFGFEDLPPVRQP